MRKAKLLGFRGLIRRQEPGKPDGVYCSRCTFKIVGIITFAQNDPEHKPLHDYCRAFQEDEDRARGRRN